MTCKLSPPQLDVQSPPLRRSGGSNLADRNGIVLLVVLGMLTLFSVLGVSYLVFTSRQRSAAVSISRSETGEFDGDQLLGDALEEILVGSTGPDSSLWGHDLLGDLYGMRDGFTGRMTDEANFVVADPLVSPAVLVNNFVRIPTELFRANSATYTNRRADATGLTERIYPGVATTAFDTDDELAGRVLTFHEGPLAGLSFPILRSFGDHTSPAPTPANGRQILSGQLVLDMRPHLAKSITVDLPNGTETRTLAEWIERAQILPVTDPNHRYISTLFYDRAPEDTGTAAARSDFYVNGRILNGTGLGFDIPRPNLAYNGSAGDAMNLNEVISTNLNPTLLTRSTPAPPPAPSIIGGTAFEGSTNGTDVPVALQGHYSIYRAGAGNTATREAGYLQDLPSGDVDEAYDAPDEQNLWLSYFPTDERLGASAPSFVRPGVLHWLVNQQGGSLDTMPVARLRQILRAIQRSTLRPLRIANDTVGMPAIQIRGGGVLQLDYSEFRGSNESDLGLAVNFAQSDPVVLASEIRRLVRSLAGADSNGDGYPDWDVDNNGDGIPDSVWVDAGLPMTESSDGTLIKPLVAYLVEDLGGRANVNLVGNLLHRRGAPADPNSGLVKSAEGVLYRNAPPTAATVVHNNLPVGFGYGPAEINMRSLFNLPSSVGNGPLNLFRRRLNSIRFGGVEYVAAGHLVDPLTDNGTSFGNDFAGVMRQPNLPNLHNSNVATDIDFGLPVDKFGRSTIALGIDGGLMVSNASATVQNAGAVAGDSHNDPYEFDPSPGASPDNQFTYTDLEGILRFSSFDRDALDSALVELTNEHFSTIRDRNAFANSITTISNGVSTATGTLPQEYRDDTVPSRGSNTLFEILTAAIELDSSPQTENRNDKLLQLLPQSVISGGKMDLNRPFGNGFDDDGNGVVDDPQELRTAVQVLYDDFTGTRSNTFYSTPYIDVTASEPGPDNSNFPNPTPQALFARHLYVMAMILVREQTSANAAFDFTFGTAPPIDSAVQTQRENPVGSGTFVPNTVENEYRAWRIAQWAINVADFRDADGIMSRFEYDVYPYDGWHTNPVTFPPAPPATNPTSRVVWGMEYPELALEESLAFHDRRVRDTNLDNDPGGASKRYESGTFQDDDIDQYRLPQGSLFLELRNTRSPDYLRVPADDADDIAQPWAVPAELYSRVDTDPDPMVTRFEYMLDLARRPPNDRNPVWRIAVTTAHDISVAPSGPTAAEIAEAATLSADELLQPDGSAGTRPFIAPVNRLSATMQPELPNFFGPPTAAVTPIDRVIWFTNVNPDNGLERDGSNPPTPVNGDATPNDGIVDFAPLDSRNVERIFYNRYFTSEYPYQVTDPDNLTEVHLRGGQYAIVGPREVTYVGSLESNAGTATHDMTTGEPLVPYADYESPQRFSIRPTLFEYRTFTDRRATPTVAGGAGSTIRNTLGILAAANEPTGFTGPPIVTNAVSGLPSRQGIGVNVSEPLPNTGYYTNPSFSLKPSEGFPVDAYRDYEAGTGQFPDLPFDARPGAELYDVFGMTGERTGTRERFKTAYLQRLADPTQPHDEVMNPYLSVDYLTIDLTVFNGSERNTQETETGPPAVTQWIDKNNPDPFGTMPDEAFATRYKTGRTLYQDATTTLTTNENLSHSVNTFPPDTTTASTALGGHVPFFNNALHLNANVDPDTGAVDNMPTAATRITHSSTLGYANFSYGPRWQTSGTGDAQYAGTPTTNWFSTLSWLNRPFVSPSELMWVPTTSAAGLGASFGTATADTNFTTAADLYEGTGAAIGAGERLEFNRVFPHLWNFYSNNPADFTLSPNLYRVFNFVDVPAPYDFENDFLSTNRDVRTLPVGVGTPAQSTFGGNINYNALGTPANVTANPSSWTTTTATSNAFWLNRYTIEPFRAPFNILQPQYRQGRINLNTIKTPTVYRALMEGISDSTDAAEGAFFDEFRESRRGYAGVAGSESIRQVGSTLDQFDPAHAGQFTGAFKPQNASDLAPITTNRVGPLNRTLLRPSGTTGAFGNEPLFQKPLDTTISGEFRKRTPVLNQLGITRLNNLATDQSNAFGVWITVGLFKVNGSQQVGAELGSDIGENRRFRSFHIIDRSVPVMYQPGVLNNALDTVQLSRTLN